MNLSNACTRHAKGPSRASLELPSDVGFGLPAIESGGVDDTISPSGCIRNVQIHEIYIYIYVYIFVYLYIYIYIY